MTVCMHTHGSTRWLRLDACDLGGCASMLFPQEPAAVRQWPGVKQDGGIQHVQLDMKRQATM